MYVQFLYKNQLLRTMRLKWVQKMMTQFRTRPASTCSAYCLKMLSSQTSLHSYLWKSSFIMQWQNRLMFNYTFYLRTDYTRATRLKFVRKVRTFLGQMQPKTSLHITPKSQNTFKYLSNFVKCYNKLLYSS